ncbi:unnamed protein product [Symbiodinium sp. KB8]|nr:unnamed protein product [Symbiodinium sp. KB8]
MEFDFDVGRVLVPFALEGDAGEGTPQALNGGKGALLRELLGVLGEGSRRAQGLSKPVTTAGPLMSNRIYLLYMGRYALGLLKVGTKRLFVSRGEKEGLVDISPTCVLDFYVVEGHQRGGLGRRLFDTMLRCEHTSPERLAYDRPSPKLIGFLRRHYGLAPYQPQANHFVVFDAYWAKAGAIRDSSARDCEKFRRPEGPGTGGKTSACTGALGTELIGDEGNETQELPENLKAEEAAAIFRLVLHGRLESRSATLSKEKRQRTPKPQVSHFPERWHRRWRLSFEVSALERQLSTVRGELEEDAPLKELGNWAERKFAMESQRLQSLEKELGNTEVRLGTKVQEMNAEAACCASPAQVARIRLDLELDPRGSVCKGSWFVHCDLRVLVATDEKSLVTCRFGLSSSSLCSRAGAAMAAVCCSAGPLIALSRLLEWQRLQSLSFCLTVVCCTVLLQHILQTHTCIKAVKIMTCMLRFVDYECACDCDDDY